MLALIQSTSADVKENVRQQLLAAHSLDPPVFPLLIDQMATLLAHASDAAYAIPIQRAGFLRLRPAVETGDRGAIASLISARVNVNQYA